MIKVLVCDDDKMITDKVKHLLNDIQEQYSFELNIQIYNDGQSVMKENEVFDIAIADCCGRCKGIPCLSGERC